MGLHAATLVLALFLLGTPRYHYIDLPVRVSTAAAGCIGQAAPPNARRPGHAAPPASSLLAAREERREEDGKARIRERGIR